MYRSLVLLVILLVYTAAPVAAAMPASTINLAIEAEAGDLAVLLERALPRELYKGNAAPGIVMTVVRSEPPQLTAHDDFIHVALPVQVTFGAGLYALPPLRAGLRFKVRLHATPDWRIASELVYTGLSDSLTDTVRLGPLTLKPKSMVEASIQPLQRLLTPLFDNKLNDALQLKARVTPLWQQAFTPLLLNKELSTWLRLSPQAIAISPIQARNNRILLSLGLISDAAITVGPQPAATVAPALPPLRQQAQLERSFHIQLGVEVFLSDLATALQPILLNKTFGSDRRITVNSFALATEQDRLVVRLSASGDFDGELTVKARPVHTPQSNRLSFEEVDFDTRNTGWLLSAGSWLFSSSIRETIKEKLDSAVVEQLEAARLKAAASLNALQLTPLLSLQGSVNSLTLAEPSVLPDRLAIQVIARGEAALRVR